MNKKELWCLHQCGTDQTTPTTKRHLQPKDTYNQTIPTTTKKTAAMHDIFKTSSTYLLIKYCMPIQME